MYASICQGADERWLQILYFLDKHDSIFDV